MKVEAQGSKKLLIAFLALAMMLVSQFVLPIFLGKASAVGAMTYTMVRTDRMKQNTATTGTVCAKPVSTATETSVKVTFPTDYTVSTTVGNWAVSTATTTSWPKDPADGTTSATAWPSIAQPTGAGEFVIAGQAVNFVSGDLTAGTWYCFNWTNTAALTTDINSAQGNNLGTVITQTTGGTASDTGNYATATLSNDQISVSATVNASFSFSLSSNSAALGTLSTAAPSEATAINASVSTNATKGWDIWAYDTAGTPGLTSTTASKTIAYTPAAGSAPVTLTNAAEGFNLGVGTSVGGTCGGTTTIDTNFASGGTQFRGGGLDNTPRSIAVGTGASSACLIPMKVNASITALTPAATDYAAIMTVVAAGRF